MRGVQGTSKEESTSTVFQRMMPCKRDQERADKVGSAKSDGCGVGRDLWGGAQNKKKLVLEQAYQQRRDSAMRLGFSFLDTYQGETHTPVHQIRWSITSPDNNHRD